MQEIIDQLITYLKGIWNKRWYGMFITWLVCLIGWVNVYQMPDTYQSKAKLYIDTQSLLKPLLRGLTISTNVSQEINLMVKTLLTKPNVEKIIRLSDLDLNTNSEAQLNGLVRRLQKTIKFKKASRARINIYNLSFTHENPKVAKTVLQSVITVFVENSLGQNKQDSSSAKEFINKQIVEYEVRLSESENRLKEFKQNNVGMLPSSKGGFYSRMEQAKAAVEKIKLELKESRRVKISLQSEVDKMTSNINKSYSHKSVILIKTSYDARIQKLQLSKDELLLKYTSKHPDLKIIKRVLSDLEEKRLAELELRRDATSSGSNGLELNPVYQDLKIKIGTINSKISSLTVRLAEYEKRYDELSKLVNHIPEVEAKLTALNRDYGVTKKKYISLLERRETATLSENISKTTDSVQFNVLEAPTLPKRPSGPKRMLFSSLIFLLSILLGVVSAFFISQIRPVFNSTMELERFTGLPILGTVSAVTSLGQRRRRGMLVLGYLSLLFALFLTYAALMAWYMQGFWKMIDNLTNLF